MLVRMIAQSHLDPIFMWPWEEGLAETLSTCQTAVKLLEKYPDLIFIKSDALAYEWIRDYDPPLLQKIKELVNQGRWILVGGYYVQSDGAGPMGEGHIRQALYGQKILSEMFNKTTEVAYFPDTWGHSETLPKILAHCGFKYFTFGRPNHNRLPLSSPLFHWKADDGSSVLSYRIPVRYCTYADEVDRIKTSIQFAPAWLDQVMCFFGLGNHGGGPTEKQLERVANYSKQTEEHTIVFSHPKIFFEDVNQYKDIPAYRGDLERNMVGCYSAAFEIKKLYCHAVRELLQAEKYSVMAELMSDLSYPVEKLLSCWKNVLFCEFHDILPGTAIKKGLDYSGELLAGAKTAAQQLKRQALQRIVNKISTDCPSYVYVVAFNNTNTTDTFHFEYEPWLLWQKWQSYKLVDSKGQVVPSQQIQAAPAAVGHTRLLIKTEIPANGYKLLRVIGPEPDFETLGPDSAEKFKIIPRHVKRLSTQRYTVDFHNDTNAITGIVDNTTNIKIGEDITCEVLDDKSDTWSVHKRGYADCRTLGTFTGTQSDLTEAGPLRWKVRRQMAFDKSSLKQDISFFDDSGLIRFDCDVQWHQPQSLLKIDIPLPFAFDVVEGGMAFGRSLRKETGIEYPFHHYLLVQPKTPQPCLKAMAIIVGTDIHSMDFTEHNVRLTVIRSPLYCHEELERPYEPAVTHEYMDLGRHQFSFGLLPVYEDIDRAKLLHLSEKMNNPVELVTTNRHGGTLASDGQLFKLTDRNICFSSLKKAENGKGYVIRFWETSGKHTQASLYWKGQIFDMPVSPNQICSCRLSEVESQWNIEKSNGIECHGK